MVFVEDEKHPDEEFMGNIEIRTSETCAEIMSKHPVFSKLPTARCGKQALDIHGNKLPTKWHKPLFLNKSDMPEHERLRAKQLREIKGW